MGLAGLAHARVWKELPDVSHERVREAMDALLEREQPSRHRQVEPPAGSRYPRSYRLRVGDFRVCFIHFPDEDTVVFTTAFRKRRGSDYDQAVERHDARVQAYE